MGQENHSDNGDDRKLHQRVLDGRFFILSSLGHGEPILNTMFPEPMETIVVSLSVWNFPGVILWSLYFIQLQGNGRMTTLSQLIMHKPPVPS